MRLTQFHGEPKSSGTSYPIRRAAILPISPGWPWRGGFNGIAVHIGLAEKFYWAMLEKARRSMDAGATGLIFGRNVWQRDHDEPLAFVARLQEILAKYPRECRRAR
jgi:hypothetical protein